MAVQLIGGMAVPINARYKASELAYVLENADIDLVVTHDQSFRIRELCSTYSGSARRETWSKAAAPRDDR